MKRLFLSCGLLISLGYLLAQNTIPDYRIVYLLDVTLSMHGYTNKNTPDKNVYLDYNHTELGKMKGYSADSDIYDDLITQLINDIGNTNSSTEIYIIPFNDKVLTDNIMHDLGSDEGKKRLISKIKSLKVKDVTSTNLVKPLEYAENNILKNVTKKGSRLVMITDGLHNDKKQSVDKLDSLLEEWCNFSETYNVTGMYIALGKEAINDKFRSQLQNSCFKVFEEFKSPNCFSLHRGPKMSVIEDYNKPIRLSVLLEKENCPLKGNTDLRIQIQDNPYIHLDTTLTITETTKYIEVIPIFEPLDFLKQQLPIDTTEIVKLEFEQIDNGNAECNNELMTKSLELQLVNKRQRIMRISIKNKD